MAAPASEGHQYESGSVGVEEKIKVRENSIKL
jgi:hypothetical protein